MTLRIRSLLLAPLCALVLAACGGGSGSGGTGIASGTMRLSLTDAPACGYDEVWVTIERVRVHKSASAGENDGAWEEFPLANPTRIDLLTLNNGTLLPLGEKELEAGTYTQLRLVLAPNTPSDPYANAILPTGGELTPLTTPSGQQSGLKANVNMTVPEGEVVDFAIDFDACKSFVKAGRSGKYIIKPVLRVIPILSTAGQRIVGFLDPLMVDAGASVTVQVAGTPDPVRATPPDENGMFILNPVPVGNYDLVITAAGRVNAVMTGVPVTATSSTVIGSSTVRFDTPFAAASYPVTGVITTATDVSVRALQTLTSGPVIEVAWVAADADTGVYGFTLPATAPYSVAYAPNLSAISFTADGSSAYTIEASNGVAGEEQAVEIDPFVAAVADLDFVFP